MPQARHGIVFALLLLAGCGSQPPLEPRPGSAPAGIDFAGDWLVESEEGVPLTGIAAPEQTIVVPTRDAQRRPPRPRRDETADVRVFLEAGTRVRITQTPYTLFFAYDRAIVEEYTFGENRLVQVGPVEAQRVSGWDGEVFIVETQGRDGSLLTERWRFDVGRDRLLRDVALAKGGTVSLRTRQVLFRK